MPKVSLGQFVPGCFICSFQLREDSGAATKAAVALHSWSSTGNCSFRVVVCPDIVAVEVNDVHIVVVQ